MVESLNAVNWTNIWLAPKTFFNKMLKFHVMVIFRFNLCNMQIKHLDLTFLHIAFSAPRKIKLPSIYFICLDIQIYQTVNLYSLLDKYHTHKQDSKT